MRLATIACLLVVLGMAAWLVTALVAPSRATRVDEAAEPGAASLPPPAPASPASRARPPAGEASPGDQQPVRTLEHREARDRRRRPETHEDRIARAARVRRTVEGLVGLRDDVERPRGVVGLPLGTRVLDVNVLDDWIRLDFSGELFSQGRDPAHIEDLVRTLTVALAEEAWGWGDMRLEVRVQGTDGGLYLLDDYMRADASGADGAGTRGGAESGAGVGTVDGPAPGAGADGEPTRGS